MKVKEHGETSARSMSVQDAIERIVRDAPDYYDGEIETIRAKLDKLTQIVGRLVEGAFRTEQEQLDFLNEISFRSWEKAEE